MVVQTAPSVRVSIGEELGLAPGTVETGQMVAAQRALGFDYVFDSDFSADLTIMEEGEPGWGGGGWWVECVGVACVGVEVCGWSVWVVEVRWWRVWGSLRCVGGGVGVEVGGPASWEGEAGWGIGLRRASFGGGRECSRKGSRCNNPDQADPPAAPNLCPPRRHRAAAASWGGLAGGDGGAGRGGRLVGCRQAGAWRGGGARPRPGPAAHVHFLLSRVDQPGGEGTAPYRLFAVAPPLAMLRVQPGQAGRPRGMPLPSSCETAPAPTPFPPSLALLSPRLVPCAPPGALQSYPELIPHLSSCKSPQMMMGAVVKHYWAKKKGLKPEDVCLVSCRVP